jgi:hypothetical protein
MDFIVGEVWTLRHLDIETFGYIDFKAALRTTSASLRRTSSATAPITNARMFWIEQFIFFMSDCFTSKRDELRLGQDLTECNERKVTMKKLKDH